MLFCDCERAAACRTLATAGNSNANSRSSRASTTRSWNNVNAGRGRSFMGHLQKGRAARGFAIEMRNRERPKVLCLLQQIQMFELATQHGLAVAAKPAVEQCGVQPAEVG